MRGSVLGSSFVHVALLVVLLAVRTAAPIIVPGPEVVQVALVEPTPTPSAPPPAPAPPPDATAPEIKPTEDVGVKIEKKEKPKKPKKEEKKEPPAPQSPAAALPYAAVGNAGLQGQITLDASDFEFTYYLLLVRNRIGQNWTPPAGLVTRGQPVRAVVYFKIARGGGIFSAALETSSSAEFFDRSALRAVMISDPLPPLPLGFSGSDLGVHFGFEYSAP
jgi:protein TonB